MTETRLDTQPWMQSPATRAVLDALADGGATVRFVGGCLRDAVLGRPIKDIDFATDAPPERVMDMLRKAGLKAIPTGIGHGTVTAVSNHQPYEITTLRHDVETDGRRAVVAFIDDWEADAARRDFTMNALSLDPDGTLHDPFGGLADLRAGRVRFVGDPRQRIAEDVLRLLRYFRFHAHYGRPPPHAESLAACREMAHLLPRLSAERVRSELLRLLAASDPAAVIRLMRDEGVLEHFLSPATAIDRLERLVAIETARGLCDPLRRLAALLAVDADIARHLVQGLRLSNEERDRLVAMAGPGPVLAPGLGGAERRRAFYCLNTETWADAVLLAWASSGAGSDDPAWRNLYDEAASWQRPDFPLTGRDVTKLGVPQGAAVGRFLRAVEDWWVAGDFRADRKACLERLAVIVARDRP